MHHRHTNVNANVANVANVASWSFLRPLLVPSRSCPVTFPVVVVVAHAYGRARAATENLRRGLVPFEAAGLFRSFAMSTSATLPPSSPRLPSPPPPAEIQLGPKSPGLGNPTASRHAQEMEQTIADANARRRIHPGTKAEDMAAGPPLVPLAEVRSVSPSSFPLPLRVVSPLLHGSMVGGWRPLPDVG